MLIRYYFDEHIFSDAATTLKHRNIDVLTTLEAGNIMATDREQLEFAASHGRVLVTRDKDHLILHSQGVSHAGIVRWHSKNQSHSYLIRQLIGLWRTHRAEDMVGRIEYY